jgi:hypothetical protein
MDGLAVKPQVAAAHPNPVVKPTAYCAYLAQSKVRPQQSSSSVYQPRQGVTFSAPAQTHPNGAPKLTLKRKPATQ